MIVFVLKGCVCINSKRMVSDLFAKINFPWGDKSVIQQQLNLMMCTLGICQRNMSIYIDEQENNSIRKELREYILNVKNQDSTLDGDFIQSTCFPVGKYDIFLSHSSLDKEVAYGIKYLLESLDISVFVDSLVWGFVDDLLRLIDDRYCRIPGNTTYSYDKRNNTTAAVHMMLSTALTQVMDASEYVCFLNTSNSNLGDAYGNEVNTASPWIYHELETAKVLRSVSHYLSPGTIRSRAQDSVNINHKVDMSSFYTMNVAQFGQWLNDTRKLSISVSERVITLLNYATWKGK